MDAAPTVLVDCADRIATVTLNRPDARNALSSRLLGELVSALAGAEADPGVDVVILTGADPAFCAGLDLNELATPGNGLVSGGTSEQTRGQHRTRGPFPKLSKPLIGAINGDAITGGFELALNCDFLVASERARFGDTHSRVGVMPGWGLTVLLPQAIGVRRAREMSFTGNFVGAEEALRLGLVNHVVEHDRLLPFTRQLATDIVGNDQAGVRQLKATYHAIVHDDDAWETEARDGRAWQRSSYDPARVAARRAGIVDRGRSQ
jgi:enoyl-CoA hydratase